MGQIEDLLIELVRKGSKNTLPQIIWGKATQITETTCTVIREDDPTIEDVLLNAVDDTLQTNYTVYPKEGSMVLVGVIEGLAQMAVVLKCSEVDRIVIKTGNDVTIETQTDISLKSGNGKIEMANNSQNLGDILGSLIDTVAGAKLTTPSGAGTISPDDITALQLIKTKLNLLLK
ncbi:MAG: hypothetical protein LBI60_02945 [Bacteroidales bacterium]|jgi:hypothetical protein|nr:hypothetical protein [Bacteroidales bacterium]